MVDFVIFLDKMVVSFKMKPENWLLNPESILELGSSIVYVKSTFFLKRRARGPFPGFSLEYLFGIFT